MAVPTKKKKVRETFTLQVACGKATPGPPIGPKFGSRGLNIMEFCKGFNAKTQGMKPGVTVTVVVIVYVDKTFDFLVKTPLSSELIKEASGVTKGSARPHIDKVGQLTVAQITEIAKTKIPDLNASDLDAAIRTIAGSARSMGITVAGG